MTIFAKVPVTVVTGFLGAGKTTMIRHLLAQAEGRRLALIVNEFGDVGVDGDILRACGVQSCPAENIIELANGCLCCTVAEDFVPAIEALLRRAPRPDHIIVETSGLALPKPLVKAFDWPAIRAKVTVDGVIAVVDAASVAEGRFVDAPEKLAAQRAADPALDHDNPLEEVYQDQLLCADLIVLNKSDLIAAEDLVRVKAGIEALLPRAVKIVATSEGRIEAKILLGLDAAAEDDLLARPSHHDGQEGHDHDDFESFVLDVAEIQDPARLVTQLAAVSARHDVLRMKGFLSIRDKPLRLLLQGVGGRFRHNYDRAWGRGEVRQGRLVMIGRKGLDRAAVAADLEF